MPLDVALANVTPHEATTRWLTAFEDALAQGDGDAAAALFLHDGYWRDLVAFTWHIRTFQGESAIAAAFNRTVAQIKPTAFRVSDDRMAPSVVSRAGVDTIEAIFTFETAHGNASGVVRLVPDPVSPGELRAWILATTLEDLSKHGIVEGVQVAADAYSRDFGGENWLDKRLKTQAFEDREPAVLVVGAGQAGLGVAARLGALGVDTLLIDRHERVGDNWRKRYHSLTLHNEVHVNHLPFMPFPKTFPVFIPKDKLANWFETYAECMELNVWTGTELVGGDYDDDAGHWTVRLRKTDGTERIVKPRHVVFAVGVSSMPVMPDVPGLDTFAGPVVHSGAYTDGHEWKGRKALVVGTGNSAHDVAQDLHASGADVTMVQRNTTYIVSLREAQKVYAIYNEGPSVDDCDLISTAAPYNFLIQAYKQSTAEMKAADKPLLDGLTARGFRLDFGGEDDTGFQMKYLRRGGGYYFNVGCSDLIVDGRVKVIHYQDLDKFVPEGAQMKDGSVTPADVVVAATGYLNQQEVVRAYMGDAIAERTGQVWGFDTGGELANMWKRTPQPGIWFTAGSLAQCRIFSKYLALQIAAIEAGLMPKALGEGGG
ncbi:MAG: NAD(P)/FAD-dependent oxidoreductase [Pseudomonadota bacterium]